MINIPAFKRSLYLMSIFGIFGPTLAAFSHKAGIASGGNGWDFSIIISIFVLCMYLPCQYFAYKVAESYILDELDRESEMFSRYDGVTV